MHFNSLALATLALVPFIEAHGDGVPGAPKIFGRRSPMRVERAAEPMQKRTVVESMDKRQASGNTEGQCGQGFGSCAPGYCCSEAGWCGQGTEYCSAPGCQFNFGPACDDNTIPSGASTANVARPKVGNVLYGGAGIYDCEVPGTIAITYDDGPYIYTEHILDLLKQYGARATFFITGNNNGKGQIDNAALPWAATVKRTYNEGHQIASHTWTHPHLSNLTSAQRKQNMISNEMALRNILGFFPTYMRPPYSDCTAASGCEADLADLGYHISYFDIDTDDYNNDSPALIQNAKNNFDAGVRGGNPATDDYLLIGHDIHQQTAYNLTEYMLQRIQTLGYKAVTMGECMGDPEENWYRKSDGSVFTSATTAVSSTTSSAIPAPTSASPDGTCGGTTGFTCKGSAFGDCCSPAGWCGSGNLYCGEGCQNVFGTCGINVPVTGSTTTTSAATAAPTAVSTDATCGSSGFTCQGSVFGNCCSVNGWCGSTEAYCGSGCQSGFGSCGDSGVKANPAIVASNSNAATPATLANPANTEVVTSTKTTQAATQATAAPKATATKRPSFSGWFGGLFNKAFHH